jgi:hypothetical protein
MLESNLKNAGPNAIPPSPNRNSPEKQSRPKQKREFLRRKTPTSAPIAAPQLKKYKYYAQNFDSEFTDENHAEIAEFKKKS